jgi:hypothetical protein
MCIIQVIKNRQKRVIKLPLVQSSHLSDMASTRPFEFSNVPQDLGRQRPDVARCVLFEAVTTFGRALNWAQRRVAKSQTSCIGRGVMCLHKRMSPDHRHVLEVTA